MIIRALTFVCPQLEEFLQKDAVKEQIVEQCSSMGFSEGQLHCAYAEVLKASNTINPEDVVNYILQHMDSKAFSESVDAWEVAHSNKAKGKVRVIPLELQRLFTSMQLLNRESISTEGLKPFQFCMGTILTIRKSCRFDKEGISVAELRWNHSTRRP